MVWIRRMDKDPDSGENEDLGMRLADLRLPD
jgi:hypothetical protein